MTKQPLEKVREGNVSFAIWSNKGKTNDFKTASLQFQYKDGDTYRDSNSYTAKDLENLEKAARETRLRMTKSTAPIDKLDA